MICNKSRQTEFYDSLQSVLNSKIYQQHSKSFSKSLRLEDSITSEFSEATSGILMTTYNQYDTHKPMLWWKQKINSISKMEENPKDIYKRNAAKRIKGQIGVMLWETNRRLMQEKYYNQSLELADILLLLDPESATYMALKSEVLAAQGKTTQAKEVFNEAKNKGFTFDNAFLGKSQILKQLDKN
jgi:tetratricopeptide (TPR) repeat protein